MSWTSGIFTRDMGESGYMLQARMRAEIEEVRRSNERRAMKGMYLRGDGCWVSPVEASPASKCAGCGSHEWRQHNNVRICAYCRSGQ